MTKPIAYVIGGSLNAETEARIEAGFLPRFEYHEFLARNNADLLTYGHIVLGRSAAARLWRKLDKPNLAVAALAIERAGTYGAILCSGEDVGLPIALGMRLTRARIPVYIITHGSYLGSPKFSAAASLLRRLSSVRFLTLSNALRTDLIERFGFPESQVVNTGYGIDTDFFKPIDVAVERDLVASAGTANRDYRTLVAAVRPLDARLKIAADSAWFPTAIDIREDALPANVEARSCGDYIGLRDLYAAASIVVTPLYPAKYACGYAVIAEAMAMGKPVITTRIDAHSDYVVDQETGYYVSPASADELRTRIVTLLEHPELAAKMGEAGRAKIEKEHSLDAYCSRIEAAMGLPSPPRPSPPRPAATPP